MNTYEKCQAIRRIILNRVTEVMAYTNRDDEFAAKEIREIPQSIKKMENGADIFGIDPSDMTNEQMIELGFRPWSKDNPMNPMRLIPLWLFHFLADEFETECIDREKQIMKKSKMDTDNRFGRLAYGVIPKLK